MRNTESKVRWNNSNRSSASIVCILCSENQKILNNFMRRDNKKQDRGRQVKANHLYANTLHHNTECEYSRELLCISIGQKTSSNTSWDGPTNLGSRLPWQKYLSIRLIPLCSIIFYNSGDRCWLHFMLEENYWTGVIQASRCWRTRRELKSPEATADRECDY